MAIVTPLFDLIVIGAGPGGASAAITARRHGASVLLLEQGSFPRQKVCGEFVSAESLGLLSGLLTQCRQALLIQAPRISRARIFLDGRTIITPVNPAASSIPRLELDSALWQSAREFGVDARDLTRVQKITGDGPFEVETIAGQFKSRAVINATGRWSNLNSATVRKKANLEAKWVGLKAHFYEASPDASVDLYFFDGGYCGVQPIGSGRINAAAMVKADVATTLEEVFKRDDRLFERSRQWRQIGAAVTTSPLIFHEPEPTDGNTFRAGDAASFVDPFVGDGISLALRSGALAAESLKDFVSSGITLPEAIKNYSESYEKKLGPIFRTSSKIRRLLRLPRPVRTPFLFVLDKAPALTHWMVSETR